MVYIIIQFLNYTELKIAIYQFGTGLSILVWYAVLDERYRP